MKSLFTKMFVTGIIAAGAVVANGQEVQSTDNYEQKMGDQKEVPFGAEELLRSNASKKLGKLEVEEWYNYQGALSENGEGVTYFTGNSIWPDSTAVQIFSDDNGNPYPNHVGTHALGQVFDPTSEHFNLIPETPSLSRFNNHTVDSVGFFYKYMNANPGVVDTLVIGIYNNADVIGLTYTSSTSGQQWRSASFRYNQSKNAGYSPTKTIKIPLSESTEDFYNTSLASFSGFITFETGLGQTNGGSLTGYTVSYVPGMAWQFGDTIVNDSSVQGATKLNSFMPLVVRQGTVQNPAFLTDTSMSHGVFAYSFIKYSERATEYFYPGNLTTTPARTHVYSMYKLKSLNVGVDEINANGYGLGNAYPNPVSTNAEVNIPFTLGHGSTVNIEMFDLVGKSITNVTSNRSAGNHVETLSTNNLKPGIYLYTITAGEYTASKKFTVK